jgi:hypothetical protein
MVKKSFSLSCWNFSCIKYCYLVSLITCIGSGSEVPIGFRTKYFALWRVAYLKYSNESEKPGGDDYRA